MADDAIVTAEPELITVDVEQLREALGVRNQSGAETDDALVELWLHEKWPRTAAIYADIVGDFLDYLQERQQTLRTCTVEALQTWRDAQHGAPRTVRLRLAAVKSLLSFAHRTGYTLFNVGPVVGAPRAPDSLTDRVLTREEVFKLFGAATPRSEPLMRIAYYSGARIEELCKLRWRDVRWHEDQATITLLGKGQRIRHVRLTEAQSKVLHELQPEAPADDAYVFGTRTGKPLHPCEAVAMVKRAATRAGVKLTTQRRRGAAPDEPDENPRQTSRVSPHWFRHAHATHALEGGAPIHLVQATLGHASLGTTGQYLHASPEESSGKYLGE